jgi:lipopolysaccharide/colanic/teichoic acid biosynthesis glycosyltransferase
LDYHVDHALSSAAATIDIPHFTLGGVPRRIFEISFSLAILVLMSPLSLLAMLAIVIESPGSPFFTQRRLGKNGREFLVIKLRTMVPDAERFCGPKLAEKDDTRITRVGRVLRMMRIDELPQFLNVIRGEMSIVGPRPERPEIHESIIEAVPAYRRRLAVKPGITGLAQIRGDYHIDFRHKLRYDLLYIRNKSITLDLKIMAMTLWVVLARKGSA